jgi:hypothetical protein
VIQFFLGLCLFIGMMVLAVIGGIAVAVAFTWAGNKAFDCIAAGQEWQKKMGWW